MEFFSLTLVLFILVIVLCSVAVSRDRRIPTGMPPGPAGIPLLGYIPWLSAAPYRDFHKLRKDYGDIFSIRLGRRWHVVLNGSMVIRRALVENGPTCSGRPNWVLNRILKGQAIANEQPDSNWRMHRSFWFSLFRELGHDKIQTIVTEELECMKSALLKENGSPIDPSGIIKLTFCNIICSLCFGKRYAAGDEEFHRLQHNADIYMQNLAKASRTLPFCGQAQKVFEDILSGHKGIIDFIKERVEEHKTMRLRLQSRTRDDLLDIYFNRANTVDEVDHLGIHPDLQDYNMSNSDGCEDKSTDQHSNRTNNINEANLPHIVLDIFVGGMETTNAAVLWSLLTMVKYPEVQKRVQKELDEVVGPRRVPDYQQLNQLPYVKATLLEIYRAGNIIPIAIPHCVTQPVTINGYNIPVGTRLLPNIYAAHMDPKEWSTPELFDPSRFINEQGEVKIPPGYMPFSVGKRVCMGENLAKKELFLTFTTILQHFTLLPADEEDILEFDGIPGTTRSPLPFKLRAVPRDI